MTWPWLFKKTETSSSLIADVYRKILQKLMHTMSCIIQVTMCTQNDALKRVLLFSLVPLIIVTMKLTTKARARMTIVSTWFLICVVFRMTSRAVSYQGQLRKICVSCLTLQQIVLRASTSKYKQRIAIRSRKKPNVQLTAFHLSSDAENYSPKTSMLLWDSLLLMAQITDKKTIRAITSTFKTMSFFCQFQRNDYSSILFEPLFSIFSMVDALQQAKLKDQIDMQLRLTRKTPATLMFSCDIFTFSRLGEVQVGLT